MNPDVCRTLKDAVLFAIDQEKKARDFYLQCKKRAKNPGVRTFFREMAGEEAVHLKLLREIQVTEADALASSEPMDYHLSDFMVDVTFSPEMTYQEALVMAMKKEEKAHAFYNDWKGRCSSEGMNKLFMFLAAEELNHKKKIESIYDLEILQWD
jgi:rubrerythrin